MWPFKSVQFNVSHSDCLGPSVKLDIKILGHSGRMDIQTVCVIQAFIFVCHSDCVAYQVRSSFRLFEPVLFYKMQDSHSR